MSFNLMTVIISDLNRHGNVGGGSLCGGDVGGGLNVLVARTYPETNAREVLDLGIYISCGLIFYPFAGVYDRDWFISGFEPWNP